MGDRLVHAHVRPGRSKFTHLLVAEGSRDEVRSLTKVSEDEIGARTGSGSVVRSGRCPLEGDVRRTQ
jgi:hypothetical protein